MIDALDFDLNLPNSLQSVTVSKSDTSRGEEMTDREGFTSVSFTSVPPKAFRQFKDMAVQRNMFPRDLFTDALRQLLNDRKAGKEINYPAPRKGGVRRSLWLEDSLVEEMNTAAATDSVSKTVFFLTAMKRFAEREGIDVEV